MIFKQPNVGVQYPLDTVVGLIMWGQSNMSGDTEASDLPTNLARVQPNAFVFNTIQRQWQPFEPGVNSDRYGSGTKWGPDAEMLRLLPTRVGRPIYMLKYSQPGTGFYPESVADSWRVDAGDLTLQMLYWLRCAEENLLITQGKRIAWRAICTSQGEHDANGGVSAANNYQSRLEDFLAAVRGATHPQLPAVIGRLHSSYVAKITANSKPEAGTVRTAHDTIGSRIGNSLVNLDLFPLKVDDVHYTPSGYIQKGAAFADAVAPWIQGDFRLPL